MHKEKTNKRNRPLPSSKNSHFQNEARCTTLLVKMSFIIVVLEWKMFSISKADHLTSFWNRGLGKLGNGLLRVMSVSISDKDTAKLYVQFLDSKPQILVLVQE